MIIRKRPIIFPARYSGAMIRSASSRVSPHRDSNARSRRPGRTGPDRYRESLAAPGRRRVALHHWWGRHVVGGGGPARPPGRFWRHPRRCRAALYARHARLRRRRRAHGPARRPFRRRRAAGARDAGARPRLSGGRAGVHALAGGARAWIVDRDRVFGHLRTADRRPVALVLSLIHI